MSNSPLQLSPTQWARVVTRHPPLCNAAPLELVAAARHDAAPVAVLELAQADRALLQWMVAPSVAAAFVLISTSNTPSIYQIAPKYSLPPKKNTLLCEFVALLPCLV
jgi:hypothetical protein